jgi:hypothetical protein
MACDVDDSSGGIETIMISEDAETAAEPYLSAPFSLRLEQMLIGFSAELSCVFRRRFSRSFSFEFFPTMTVPHPASTQQWQLEVMLRVFQSNLWIALPLEVVAELVSLLLERERTAILEPANAEDIAAVGFLLANILAEEELFVGQRIYVASVTAGEQERDPLGATGCVSLGVRTKLEGSEYVLSVRMEQALWNRISLYSRFRRLNGDHEVILQPALPFSLELELTGLSPMRIAQLAPGQELMLDHDSGIGAEWLLRPRNCCDERDSIRRSPALRLRPSGTDEHAAFYCVDYLID